MTLPEKIEQWDRQLFLFLNGMHNDTWDVIMEWITYKFTWIPFYAFLLVFLFKKFRWQYVLSVLVFVGLLITLSDQLSVHLFKNVFERFRPCHNIEIQHLVHVVDGCGGKYGFVSSHATNTFALATFIGLIFRSRKWLAGLLMWAAFVSYSRIYVGVHYPLDIIGGAILGLLIALALIKAHRLITPKMRILPKNE